MTMKKRIISMLLIVATLVLTLAGCAYNYEKDDMTSYVEFNKDAFIAGLASLKIADGSFGVDEDKRWQKVNDDIITALAKLAETTQVTDKVIGGNDTFYYCYYVTGTVPADEAKGTPARDFTVYLDTMTKSKAVKLQLGLSTLDGLDKKIADAVKDLDITEYAYKTKTSGTTQYNATAPQKLVVTYTESYTDAESKVVTNTYTGALITIDEAVAKNAENKDAPANFKQFLVNKAVGSALSGEFKATEERGGASVEVTYKNVKINWIVEGGKELSAEIKHTPYASTSKEMTAVEGGKVDLKGIELTYHVFPVYFIDVTETKDITAKVILKDILGKSMSAGTKDDEGKIDGATLEVFEDTSYKAGDKNINEIATDLIKLLGELSEKKTAMDNKQKDYDDAKSALDKAGDAATQDQKDKESKLKGELETAKTEHTNKEKEVDDKIALLLTCTSSTEGAKAIETAIIDDYKQSIYDSKEKTYQNDIRKNLGEAIYALALENMKFNGTLPEKAVDQAYDRLMNNYEYDFYKGKYTPSNSSSSSSTTATKTNYEQYEGNFDNFLKAQEELGLETTSSRKDIEAAILEEAKASVKDTVFVYALKAACDKNVDVTEEQKEEFKNNWQYVFYLQYSLGEDNVDESYYVPALQFDNIMDYFLEVKDEDPADNKIVYERLQYTFK